MQGLFVPFLLTELPGEATLQKAGTLSNEGTVHQIDNYCYLKIADDFIHLLYPTLKNYEFITKPEYFSPPNAIGAHISIIYPEENIVLNQKDAGQKHLFSIEGLIKAQYGVKEYFALAVSSPSLAAIRQQYSLAPKPRFKGQEIVFHITIAVRVS